MEWDGKTYADIVKNSVYTVLYSTEIPQAMTMGNKEYADFLKSHHEDLNFHYPDKHRPDVSAKRNTGITITFKDRLLDDDGDKTISLTWSMAARHIRAWEYEKREAETQKSEAASTTAKSMKFDKGMKYLYADIGKALAEKIKPSKELDKLISDGDPKPLREHLKEKFRLFHYTCEENGRKFFARCNLQNMIFTYSVTLNSLGAKNLTLTWSQLATLLRDDDFREKYVFADTQEEKPQSRMREQWDNTHLCGSKYNDTLCEFFLKTDSEDTTVNGKKLDRCCYYCTSENKIRKIGSGGSWTGLSPKFCPKRKFLERLSARGCDETWDQLPASDNNEHNITQAMMAKTHNAPLIKVVQSLPISMCDSCANNDGSCLKPVEGECIRFVSKIEEDAMARKLQLDAAITKDMKSAASDSFIDNIEMIEVSDILENDDNFYSLSDIELLADDIEREGLMHNLVVSKTDEGYLLKSGHRRLAAIKLLIKEKRLKGTKIPCYVSGEKTEAETKFDLIMLNATQRKYSDADVLREYEEIERTFKALEAEGKPLKGRIRDNIAAVLKVSPAQVGKIENIKHNAVAEVEKAVKSGAMSISTANEVAKLSDEKQREIADKSPDISHKEVKKLQEKEKPSLPKATEPPQKAVSKPNESNDDLDELDELLDDDDEPDEEPEVTPERRKSSRMFTLTLSEAEASTLLDFLNEWADADCDENAVLDVWNKLKAFIG